jgi:hypothetical protein
LHTTCAKPADDHTLPASAVIANKNDLMLNPCNAQHLQSQELPIPDKAAS